MDFAYDIGVWAIIGLIVLATVFGIAVHLVGTPSFRYEWLLTTLAAIVGGFVASEFVVGFRGFEPVYDGLAVIPAIVGGVLLGAVVAGASRFLLSDTYSSSAAS